MRWMNTAMLPALTIVALIAAGPAYAGKKRSAPLPVVGRTIGGPGLATLASLGLKTIFTISGGATRDICVTVTNESATTVQIVLNPDARQLFANDTRTFCATGQNDVRASCAAPPCTIQWRVDRM